MKKSTFRLFAVLYNWDALSFPDQDGLSWSAPVFISRIIVITTAFIIQYFTTCTSVIKCKM